METIDDEYACSPLRFQWHPTVDRGSAESTIWGDGMPPRTARGAWLRALDEDECASAIFAKNRTGEVRRVITLNLEPV